MSLVVATLHGEVVLQAPTVTEYLVIPVGVLSVVSFRFQLFIGEVAEILVIFYVFRCIEDVGLLAKRLAGSLQRVAYLSFAMTVGTALCRDEYDTITGFSTVDGC